MKKRSRKKQDDQMDEHNMPTEALPDIPAMPFPTSDQSNFIPGGGTVPTLFPSYPDAQQPLPVYPYNQVPSYMDRYPSYPSSPGVPPETSYGRQPMPATWNAGNNGGEPKASARDSGDTRNRRKSRGGFLPACVGLFFFCVQLLLFVRFCVRFLLLSPDITWVSVVTGVSEIFVSPFRELWFQIPLVSTLVLADNIELYTLVAILIYGVLSRLLAGILRVMLKSR